VAVALIALDQITKFIAVEQLSDGSSHTVIPRALSFRLLYNPGATLGMGSGSTWVISVAAIVACVVLAVFALRTVSVKWTVALSIAFAGAAGNLIDRIIHADGFLNGKVTDFLDYGWSVGNVADAYLTVAAVAIVILVIMSEPFSADSAKTAKKVGNGSENE
jgi:signal peptidase II